MATYDPPLENLPIFDASVFVIENVPLTYTQALGSFLSYPVAQGTEDLSIINVNGLATFNAQINSNNGISLSNGIITNTLNQSDWTGSIKTQLSTQNLTHYINMSDSSATGQGNPQKSTLIYANPSTGNLTASTFTGVSSSSSSISLTYDDTNTTCYIPFSKTISSNSALYVDNTTTPMSYNPSTSTLTVSNINSVVSSTATAVGVNLTTDDTNTLCYIPFTKTITATNNPLYVDNTTTPMSYNPSTSTLTVSNINTVVSSTATAIGVNLTTDDTNTTCYIPFTKTITATNNPLYVDNVTGPLFYNPSTGLLTCTSLFSQTITGGATSAGLLFSAITTGSVGIASTAQTTGSISIGSTTATTGVFNVRCPIVLSRQILTTNSATYPPNAVTHLGYTIQTLGAAFTTTSVLSSTNTNLFSYAFTAANFGTYLFNAVVALSPSNNTISRQLILAISPTSATVSGNTNIDLQYTTAAVGYGYLKVTAVIPIYAVTTIYLVAYCLGVDATVQTTGSLSHFDYTRIA